MLGLAFGKVIEISLAQSVACDQIGFAGSPERFSSGGDPVGQHPKKNNEKKHMFHRGIPIGRLVN